MADPVAARSHVRAAVSHVIVRACTRCGGTRRAGVPCAHCGNPDPPVVHDLGVQSYTHRNPLRRAGWALIGQHLAARRARKAARYVPGKEGA